MKMLKIAGLFLTMASAIAFGETYCENTAHPNDMTITPTSGADEKISDGCTLNSDLTYAPSTLITSGGSGPVFKFLRGTVERGRTIFISPYDSISGTDAALPVTVDISSTNFALNAQLRFTGNFPPGSSVTVSSNFHTSDLDGAQDSDRNGASYTFFTALSLGSGSTVLIDNNRLDLYNSAAGYAFSNVMFGTNAELTINNNTMGVSYTNLYETIVVDFKACTFESNAKTVISKNTFSCGSDYDDRVVRYVSNIETTCRSCFFEYLSNTVVDRSVELGKYNTIANLIYWVSDSSFPLEGITITVQDNVVTAVVNNGDSSVLHFNLYGGSQWVTITNNTVETQGYALATGFMSGPSVYFNSPTLVTATIGGNILTSPNNDQAKIMIGAPNLPEGSSLFIENNKCILSTRYTSCIDFSEPIVADSSVIISVSYNSFQANPTPVTFTTIGGTQNPITALYYFCNNAINGAQITDLTLMVQDEGEVDVDGIVPLDQCGSLPTQVFPTTAETTTLETTTSETTTSEATTADTTTSDTTTLETTTSEVSTTATTTSETTTSETTTLAETTTSETTTLAETTTEETTTSDVTTTSQTTTSEATTVEATTTSETTTLADTTTESTTTEPTTTVEVTTTSVTTTSEAETTTSEATTSEATTAVTSTEVTTVDTTSEDTTTTEATTTVELTTTSEPTTSDAATAATTTSDETTSVASTEEEITSSEPTTASATTLESTSSAPTTSVATSEDITTSEATTEQSETDGTTTSSEFSSTTSAADDTTSEEITTTTTTTTTMSPVTSTTLFVQTSRPILSGFSMLSATLPLSVVILLLGMLIA